MDHKEWLEHFVNRTDKRFDKIEEKVDQLLKFKWQIIGGSLVASLVVTFIVQIFLKLQ